MSNPLPNKLPSRRALWVFAITFALLSLYVLGIRTLVPPDEGRYAEIAREMAASGDWITPRLNGIKYFEKPPLQAWMNAVTFTLFGLGEWQARLWTGVCGLFGVALTGLAGWRVFGARAGYYSALVLGSMFYWLACSQINSLDMGLSAMMTISLCALMLAQRDAAGADVRSSWMLACWAGMALAMLAKGLIGVILPGGALVFYSLFSRDWSIWKRLHLVKGLALFLLIAAPWFILVGIRNPEQPHFFFVHEHFDRFLLKEHHREAAWWIFLALLAVGSVPWLGALPRALCVAAKREPGTFQPRLLLLVWVVFIVAFFSKSNSKLPGYILPVFPALAMLIGVALAGVSRRLLLACAALLPVLGLTLLILVPFAPRFAKRAAELAAYQAYQPWIAGAGLTALAGGALAMAYAWRRRNDGAVATLAVASILSFQLLLAGFEPIGRQRAGVDLLPRMRDEMTDETQIYSVGIYEQSLTFYLRRPVTLVDYRDEFDFGLQQEPALAIPTLPAFAQQWRQQTQSGKPALAIVRNDLVAELRRQQLPMRIVAADERRTLIASR